jgi:hypothetical protein
MTYKIALIIPYFGDWPYWMNIYLYSCKKNPIIDIIFYTNCKPLPNIPNVKVYYMSFEEYCKKVSQKLGIIFAPAKIYKICDLKPFYGYIHQKDLEGYDFFGFGDIDLIYGNLEKFLAPKILKNYDFISTHADRVSGHFFLMRNTELIRNIGFKIKNWQELLANEKNVILDETYLSNLIIPQFKYIKYLYDNIRIKLFNGKYLVFLYNFVCMIIQYIFKYRKKHLYFKEMYSTPEIFKGHPMRYIYNNGEIIDIDRRNEIMYLHFLFFKKNLYRKKYLWDDNTSFEVNIEDLSENPMIIDKEGFHIDYLNSLKIDV